MCLIIGLNLIIKLKVCIVSRFEPLGLRYELTIIPSRRVLRRDTPLMYITLTTQPLEVSFRTVRDYWEAGKG